MSASQIIPVEALTSTPHTGLPSRPTSAPVGNPWSIINTDVLTLTPNANDPYEVLLGDNSANDRGLINILPNAGKHNHLNLALLFQGTFTVAPTVTCFGLFYEPRQDIEGKYINPVHINAAYPNLFDLKLADKKAVWIEPLFKPTTGDHALAFTAAAPEIVRATVTAFNFQTENMYVYSRGCAAAIATINVAGTVATRGLLLGAFSS